MPTYMYVILVVFINTYMLYIYAHVCYYLFTVVRRNFRYIANLFLHYISAHYDTDHYELFQRNNANKSYDELNIYNLRLL
jgi:hypothetical protein